MNFYSIRYLSVHTMYEIICEMTVFARKIVDNGKPLRYASSYVRKNYMVKLSLLTLYAIHTSFAWCKVSRSISLEDSIESV